MNIPANIRVNVSFPFPALVQGSGPITIAKNNGIWTIGYNGALLGQINTSAPLTGGPINLSGGGGIIGLAPSGVTAGAYTSANISVDAFGRILAAANGSGGGSGGSVVPTVPSLASVSPTVGATLVSDPRRGGLFVWDPSNLSGSVANDPAKGLFCPLSTDTSGATGAWRRLFLGDVQAPWFNFVNDGVIHLVPGNNVPFGDFRSTYSTTVVSGTDNSQAWCDILQWIRYEDTQGRSVRLNFPPGFYNYNLATMQGLSNGTISFYGIRNFVITGYGAVFTNTKDDGASFPPVNQGTASFLDNPFIYTGPNPFVTGPTWAGDGVIPAGQNQGLGFKINTTNIGDTSVTIQVPARTSYFSLGEWAFVGSYDIQMSGLPSNMYFGDFVQIESLNAGTGQVGLTTPLKWQHRSDFNDYTSLALPLPCGAARIWKLDTSGFGFGAGSYWDIEHTYEGFQVNLPPHFGNTGFYTSLAGRSVKTKNYKGVGFSESTMMSNVHEGDHYWTAPEIDKNIGSIIFRSCIFDFGSGAASSSIERITYEDCTLGGIGIGAKQTVLTNCTVKQNLNPGGFGMGGSQGLAGPATFINCSLETYLPANVEPSILDTAKTINVSSDGSTPITYANGTFKLAPIGAAQALLPSFQAVPGQHIHLNAATPPGFVGDMGFGIVMGMRTDGTNVFMDTTLKYATLPAWALSGVNAVMYIFAAGSHVFQNCSGSDQARIVSEACAAGYDYWNRKKYVVGGVSTSGRLVGWLGSLICADINVIQPSSTPGDVITVSFPTYTNDTNLTPDAGGSVIIINTNVLGRRTLTEAMFVGKVIGDSITVGPNPSPYLPMGRLVGDLAQWGKSATVLTNSTSPVIEMVFLFNTGMSRRMLTSNYNGTGTAQMLATTGLLV